MCATTTDILVDRRPRRSGASRSKRRAADEKPHAGPNEKPHQSPVRLGKKVLPTILVVDDDPSHAAALVGFIKETTRGAKVKVRVVGGRDEAVDVLDKHPITLAIQDVCLIGDDPSEGLGLLSDFHLEYPLVKVIALSGLIVSPDEQNAIKQCHPAAMIHTKSTLTFGALSRLQSQHQSEYDESLAAAILEGISASDHMRRDQRPRGRFRGVKLDGNQLTGPTGMVTITPKEAAIAAHLMHAAAANSIATRKTLQSLGVRDRFAPATARRRSLQVTISKLRPAFEAVGADFEIKYKMYKAYVLEAPKP